MKKCFLIWLLNDDIEPMVVGVADTMAKAVLMVAKLEGTDGFENCEYDIKEFKRNTVTINDIDYTF